MIRFYIFPDFSPFNLFANMLIFNKGLKDSESNEGKDITNLLCRFVTDGSGKTVGESIAVDEDILIIKAKDRFLGVPLKHVEDQETSVLVMGLVDYKKAFELGEKWRKESYQEIQDSDED